MSQDTPPLDAGGLAAVDIGGLRAVAQQATSPAVERGIGILLGADADVAAAAVARLIEADLLGGGLAVPALLLAARRGWDAAGAVAEIAAGHSLPEGWSAYELRAATDEAADDLQALVSTVAPSGAAPIIAAGVDAPALVAGKVRRGGVSAVHCGAAAAHLTDGLSLRRAVVDHDFVVRLATTVGWRVCARELPEGGRELDALLSSGPDGAPAPSGWEAGLDQVVARTDAYRGLI